LALKIGRAQGAGGRVQVQGAEGQGAGGREKEFELSSHTFNFFG